MWVCRLPVHIGPLESNEFAAASRKTGISCGRTESSAPTEDRGSKTARRGRRLCPPKKYNEFAGIYRKNALFCRVDATPAG